MLLATEAQVANGCTWLWEHTWKHWPASCCLLNEHLVKQRSTESLHTNIKKPQRLYLCEEFEAWPRQFESSALYFYFCNPNIKTLMVPSSRLLLRFLLLDVAATISTAVCSSLSIFQPTYTQTFLCLMWIWKDSAATGVCHSSLVIICNVLPI